ncbi:FAD-NAD(P)-binding-domain-containing protein [Hypoxylon rubiginosum]|uniref:FAD-NAD(P)-binding-domain-containing protein n=1 Tax=Hypoxylon rubiginosum TaxID=110542 RepID=A0ACB9YJK3_9PEZI|nr:FAD-NAD(P)-binding-domain-containing protein [Hypoxylon rubiginosum]
MEPGTPTSETDKRTQTEHTVPSGGRCQSCLQRREIADVLIIGAGPAAIAVALSVLEKIRKGWPMDNMTMVCGTEYSSAMDGTVCNRRDDGISLMHDQPNHFREWAREYTKTKEIGDDCSKRQLYGEYVEDMLSKVNMIAFDQRVNFKFIRQEAVDMDRYTDGEGDATIYGVKLGDGCSVYTKTVVLALGNFLKESERSGTPGYFSNPWPLSKLDEIPKGAAVGIVGTGSAAFEVLTKLHDREHEGMIYMMSGSGRLPRLARPPRNYPQTHAIHAAIRGLEKWKPSLKTFLDSLKDMLDQYDSIGISVPQPGAGMTSYADHAYNHLLSDMGKFEGDEARSVIVDALRPVAERIWTSAAPGERDYLRSHPVWKDICQETIPPNIAAIYTLHATGCRNLKIIRDVGVGREQGYFLMGYDERVPVDYVVDNAGLEHDLNEIESRSPLLKEMRKKGLVTDEPAGGIKVCFADHQLTTADDKPTRGLYAIGSLTKGTHYFVEDIDRITSHALHISDSIVGLPRSNPTQVALFVGGDLFSTVILMNLVPKLLAQGHMPYVFLIEPSTDADSLYVAENEYLYWYFETAVLQLLISDLIIRGDGPPQLALATDVVPNAYGVLVQRVRDLNDPAFVSDLEALHNIDVGFVIGPERQTAEDGLRNAFHLFRVRPGIEPNYRSTQEVLRTGGERFGYTLDRLGARVVEGKYQDTFFASKDRSIGASPCACTAMFDSYGLAVELVAGTVDKYSRAGLAAGPKRKLTPRPDGAEEVTLVALPAMMDRVLRQFATPESEDRLIRNIEAEMKGAGVPFDSRELQAWKVARNTDPGLGFI